MRSHNHRLEVLALCTSVGLGALACGSSPTTPTGTCESYRVCRRAHSLRGWTDGTSDKIFTGGTRTGCADGPGARCGVPVAVGGDHVDCREAGMHHGDIATVGAPGRA